MTYNALAFATQAATGWAADRLKQDRRLFWISLFTVLLGGIMFRLPWCSVIFLGLGNSLFHVSAGREIIRFNATGCCGHARELGLFVAPGALGIGLGAMFPSQLFVTLLISFVLAMIITACFAPSPVQESAPASKHESFGIIGFCAAVFMIFCVLCRAASGFCVPFPWRSSNLLSILLFIIIVLGKMAGGFSADHFGWPLTGLAALVISWLLFAFAPSYLPAVLLGQFSANLLMAITLFVLVRLYPSRPGLMFGLAAAVLFPGSLMQFLPQPALAFNAVYLLAVLCFASAALLVRRLPTVRFTSHSRKP